MTNTEKNESAQSARLNARLAGRDAVTHGKMAYYTAGFPEAYPYTLGGYVRARAAAIRAARITTLADFRAFRRGWEGWAVDDAQRCGWWWL